MKNNNTTNPSPFKEIPSIFWICLLVVSALLLALFLFLKPTHFLSEYLHSGTNTFLFVFLMAVLPLAGVPITLFLILVGLLFGMTWGIILTGVLILFHLAATYYLVHSFFRPLVIRLLQRFELKTPELPLTGRKRMAFLFMILPGLPYSVKNYLLALANLPLKPYLLISWTAQFGMSIPFIILGKGVIQLDPLMLLAAVGLIVSGLAIQYYLGQRYKKNRTLDLNPDKQG